MPSSPLNVVIQQLLAGSGRSGVGMTDGELLTRFLSHRDDDALAALVRRHAPMVWGVCRRLLRSPHDAEDAFQATFLVLVRKATTVVPRELVGNWLYGVAHQTAVRLRATAAKRGAREMQMKEMPEPIVAEARDDELLSLLDQELRRLPEKFRVLVVLCDLEGKSRKEVARQLGCPEGTVASRLARARGMLAKRIARNGLAVSGASLAAVMSQNVASACVPTAIVSSTIRVANLFAAGKAAGVISIPVATLTEGVLKTMLLNKIKTTTMVALALGLAAITCCGLAIGQTDNKPSGNDKPLVEKKPLERPETTDPEFELAGQVSAAAYSRDGKWLALARGDTKTVTLYDMSTWKKIHTLEGMGEVSHAVVFSVDGATVYAASNEGIVFSWNTKTGKPGAKLDAKAGMCYGLTLSPDGKLLASGHHDQEQVKSAIHLWDVATGKSVRTIASDEFVLPNTIAFTPDGKAIAGGYHASHKKTPDLTGFHGVIEWEVTTGKEIKRYDTPRITAGAVPIAHAIAYTPDGKWLIVGGGEAVATGPEKSSLYGYLWLFDRKTAKLEKTLVSDRSDYIRLLTLSPDGSKLYVPANSLSHRAPENRFQAVRLSEFQCWDTAKLACEWTYTSEKPVHVTAIAVSPNGTRVGIAESSGFKLLDTKTGEPKGGVVPAPQTDDKTPGIEKSVDKPPMAEKKPTDTALEKKRVFTPEEAIRMAESSKLTAEFKVSFVTKAILIKSPDDERNSGWVNGHSPDDVCLRPQPPTDKNQARFLAILTGKTIKQLNRDGIQDIDKHFSGKTVRATGRISRQDYRGRGTPLEVEIVIDDMSQLEVVN